MLRDVEILAERARAAQHVSDGADRDEADAGGQHGDSNTLQHGAGYLTDATERALRFILVGAALTALPVSRHRLEGAVMALEALSARPQTSISGQPAE